MFDLLEFVSELCFSSPCPCSELGCYNDFSVNVLTVLKLNNLIVNESAIFKNIFNEHSVHEKLLLIIIGNSSQCFVEFLRFARD